ncbi:MAG TPA: 2Fe-2S iron-sulfur cluster-binding protein [Candidatus Nanoarchaeia archaeon]|nr:2Fe-2S iron-sulfur cluster-binding protein [Candidatus Nanoarchaeia archaeon]
MAMIQLDDKKVELPNGEKIMEACEELAVPFGCRSGFCGTCKIEIVEGAEHLAQLTQEEKEMGNRDMTHRLACQARIISNQVKIKIENY